MIGAVSVAVHTSSTRRRLLRTAMIGVALRVLGTTISVVNVDMSKETCMVGGLFFPLVLALVGLVFGIPSYITKERRWPGMIAGFDPAKCTDVDGLTRWVGGTGMMLGGVCLIAPAAVYMAPRYVGVVGIVLALAGVVGVIVTQTGCGRFTRR
jgi:hypothetical protein